MRTFGISMGQATGAVTVGDDGKMVAKFTAPYFRKVFGTRDVLTRIQEPSIAGKLQNCYEIHT